jgi:hypothetical protein
METSMDDFPKGPRARPYAVAQSAPHRSVVHKTCTHEDDRRMNGRGLPRHLCVTTHARFPAALIVTREGLLQ